MLSPQCSTHKSRNMPIRLIQAASESSRGNVLKLFSLKATYMDGMEKQSCVEVPVRHCSTPARGWQRTFCRPDVLLGLCNLNIPQLLSLMATLGGMTESGAVYLLCLTGLALQPCTFAEYSNMALDTLCSLYSVKWFGKYGGKR